MKHWILAAALAGVAVAGCASTPVGKVGCNQCGTVRAVDVIHEAQGRTSGAGALVGAVIGGVIGHQFGSGRGQDAATAAGAVGGAMAGNEAERRRSAGISYHRVTIDMDSGSTHTVNVDDPRGLARGSRVRVVGRNLEMISS